MLDNVFGKGKDIRLTENVRIQTVGGLKDLGVLFHGPLKRAAQVNIMHKHP